jgi:hypothetical protein
MLSEYELEYIFVSGEPNTSNLMLLCLRCMLFWGFYTKNNGWSFSSGGHDQLH